MKSDARADDAIDSCLLPCGRSALPEVTELPGESAWREFRELQASFETSFADTQPASGFRQAQDSANDARATAVRAIESARWLKGGARPTTAQGVMEALVRSRHVCPAPGVWETLYAMLPGTRQINGLWQPRRPVPRAEWNAFSAMRKRALFREHIEWAAKAGTLDQVLLFLVHLSPDQWFIEGQ